MATHDYVIDNSTGANVRADLNLVLQAILSNNSSSSAPSTTAAYMWWADTTTGILKIRNSANNAWVELLQLDGTLTLEDGSASSPALAFRDDLNTGVYSSAADTFNVATGGVERMELGAATVFNEDGANTDFRIEGDNNANLFYLDAGNDRVGIGLNNPNDTFHVFHATDNLVARFESGDTGAGITLKDNTHVTSLLTTNGAFEINVDSGGDITGESLAFKISGSEKARFDSGGRLLIGTTSGSHTLTVSGDIATSGDILLTVDDEKIQLGASQDFLLFHSGSANYLYGVNNHPMIFLSNNLERLRLDSSGNVGIGVTSMSAKFHIDNGGSGNVAFLKHSASGIAVTLVLQNNRATSSLDGEQISFLDDSGTQRGKVTNNTSTTTYHTSSDYRLKENEVEISDGINRVKQLKPYKFSWKNRSGIIVDGFFAHEVENLVEDCVNGTKDRVVTEEDHKNGNYLDKKIGYEIHQMMDHSKLVPLLTAALKEAIAKIETLETKVAALESA